jgi:hypothetical protein
MVSTALLTPKADAAGAQLAPKLFRKQILRKGVIDYKGTKLNFDEAYLSKVLEAFNDGAYDQVAFQLADEKNSHTMDPERFRGEVKGLELTADGIDAIIATTESGAKVLQDNPNLGVSARLVQDLSHADGRHYTVALNHVLGTLDPRVTKMKPWEEISLSTEVVETIDLTDQKVVNELAGNGGAGTGQPPVKTPAGNGSGGDVELTAVELAALMSTLNDVGLKGSEEGGDAANAQQEAIELARQAEMTDQRNRIQVLELELARSRFDTEAQLLVSKGVPPAVVELARPLLALPAAPIIDLSNGTKVDSADVVRNILKALEGSIELGREHGTSDGQSVNEKAKQEEDALLDLWAKS